MELDNSIHLELFMTVKNVEPEDWHGEGENPHWIILLNDPAQWKKLMQEGLTGDGEMNIGIANRIGSGFLIGFFPGTVESSELDFGDLEDRLLFGFKTDLATLKKLIHMLGIAIAENIE